MYLDVKKLLVNNTVAVLSIVDSQGYPYSAVLHYALDAEEQDIFFFTDKKTHKVEPLLNGGIEKASVVIGFSETDWLTIQLIGNIRIAPTPEEKARAEAAFYLKFPNAERGDDIVALIFHPTFWKYTNYSEKPWKVITSKD